MGSFSENKSEKITWSEALKVLSYLPFDICAGYLILSWFMLLLLRLGKTFSFGNAIESKVLPSRINAFPEKPRTHRIATRTPKKTVGFSDCMVPPETSLKASSMSQRIKKMFPIQMQKMTLCHRTAIQAMVKTK